MKKTTVKSVIQSALLCGLFATAVSANAANQTWTNAPVDASWTNLFNWVSTANVPGAVNLTGNTVQNDVASFTNPIPGSLIGSATTPILIDDGTTGRSRQLGGLTFDGNAGAYVFDATTVGTTVLYFSHNQTTRINAAVTNPQTFKLAVRTRGPSSTNLRYTLLNDSTTSGANFYFANIAAQGTGATRPLVMVLDGANTGTNTLNNFGEDGTSVGATEIYKQGAGTWVLTGAATAWSSQVDAGVTGSVQVVNGTLALRDAGVLGTLTGGNVFAATNGTIRLDGVTLNQQFISVVNGGTIRANGTCTLNGLAVANVSPSSNSVATTSAGDIFTVGGTGTITNGGANVTLNVGGPGTVVLATANTYAGKWSFNSGTNQISNAGALGTGPNAHINAGAILDAAPLGASVTFAPTVSAISANGTGTAVGSTAATLSTDPTSFVDLTNKTINLTFTPSLFTGDTTHPSLYMSQGTLALGNNAFFVNNASGTALGVGTYRLIQSAGSIINGGGYAVVVTGSGMASGNTGTIVVSGGNVDLVVAPYVPKNLVWTGGSTALWDNGTSVSWLNGATPSVFNTSDTVLFNSVGSTNPTATLTGTLAPASATVDTTANNYTLSGAGQIGGSASLTKIGTGVLTVSTANSYTGGTTVSNGVLRLGANNAIPSTGSGALAVASPGSVDLNNFNNTVNGLTGDGNINNTAGGASILTVGFDNSSSVFSGTISNTSGTVGFDKVGTGTLTLSGSSSYAGPSIVDAGTVFANNPNAIGTGGSVLTVNGGLLSLGASVTVAGLYGNAGAIANAAGAGANVITVLNTSTNGSVISDGGSGTVGIFLAAGALRLNGANTYSGGTRLATGTTLAFGNVGQAGSGLVSVSNNCVVHMPTTGSPIPAVNANYVTADNSIGTFLSGTTGNSFNGQFNGSASATNMMAGTFSLGGQYSFSNFFGTVIVSNGASIRTFLGNGGVGGGDNTLFDLRGSIFHRDDSTMLLGALTGDGSIGGASVATNAGTYTYWVIGSKGLSTVYSGFISGNNRIAKTGVGTLTLNGVTVTTNTVTMPDSSTIDVAAYAPRITYAGMTTVSNGALRVSVPNTLTNGTGLTLAGASAVFDASAMGYISNQTALDISATEVVTNSFFVTNGILEVVTGQQLNGTGTIRGSVVLDADSTNTIGVSTGTLSVTNAVTMNGAVVNMDLNRTNAQISDQIAAGGAITVNGGTLNVTNLGPVLQTGDVFHLFNKARVGSGFATLNLPVSGLDPSNNVVTYVWTNKLAVNGTIEVLSGYVPPVTTSSNADLANLVLTPAGALSPAFNSNTLSYTATEAYANSAVTVTPTAADAGATIQVIYGGATNSVASGSPSGSLALNASPLVTNPVEVRVTAADATTVKSYTVNVTRQPSTSPTTLARTVGGGNLTFTWPLDHTGWTLQTQTNTRAQGLKSNWFDVSGSTVTNQMIIPVSVSEQTVFFRLFYFAP